MNNLSNILVNENCSLKDALLALDRCGINILLLVDLEGALKRTITDGDLRRLLLSGCTLEDSLASLPVKDPVTINSKIGDAEVLNLMNRFEINQVPVINDQRKPVALHLRNEMLPRILLSTPHLGDEEKKYVEEAFETNWVAPLGPNVDGFEQELADYVKTGHAAALSSGTAAIHLALRLLDVSVGDTVFCSSFTFVASAYPILYQGANPVFIDSEPATWNMSPEALERGLESANSSGNLPKAVIVVHLYGQSADMTRIMAICDSYGIPVIEDAAESLGGLYQGQHTGTLGKFGIFSFNGNKIITTSGGGMLISDDEGMIKKARYLSTQARSPAPHYEHTEVGYNYRMSNVLAGIGRGQLKVLSDRVLARREIFNMYKRRLSEFDCLEWMPEPEGNFSNRWLTTVRLNPNKTTVTPSQMISKLDAYNIEARHLWKPMHLQPLFSNAEYHRHLKQDICQGLFDTGLCLPSASSMDEYQIEFIIDRIKKILS